jgi:hypothetical protein
MNDDGLGEDPAERLLEELAALVQVIDPPPASVVHDARAAFTWRTIDSELAELQFDSEHSGSSFAGVRRNGGGPRLLTFQAGDLTVELEVTRDFKGFRVAGQLVPPQEAGVELRGPYQAATTRSDAIGRFAIEGVTPGPVTLRCTPEAGGPPVETAWVRL